MFTGKIRKILFTSLIMVLIFTMMLSAVSCDEGDEDEAERFGEGTSDIEIGEIAYGFIEEENYDDKTTTLAETKRSTELKVDTVYYCLMEFDVVARELNDGTSLMNVLVKFDNLGVSNGTTEEAGTGNVTEMIFTDAGTGSDSKVSTLAYKIPSDPNKPKKIKILIRMLPVSVGESHISVSFEPTTFGEFKILGADGITKNLEVVRVQIEAPVITVDRDNLKVNWKHVRHASYYIIYFADKTIKFEGVDQYTPVGAELDFNLSAFALEGVTFGNVKIQACSDNTNFMKSNYSNEEKDIAL